MDNQHLGYLRTMCPGKLSEDREWYPVAYILTSDDELRRKAAQYMNPLKREIKWTAIFAEDFGSGHRAAVAWAFWLWSGRRWDSDRNDEGPVYDPLEHSFQMDRRLREIVWNAIGFAWQLKND